MQKRWPSDQANHIVAFLASADIKVFGRTYRIVKSLAVKKFGEIVLSKHWQKKLW